MSSVVKKSSALTVADYFLYKANKEKKPLTNKKLQKLVYYAQAWSLVLNNKKLFSEPIEAWVHGPAVRSLYGQYKSFGFNPIIKNVEESSLKVSVKDKELLDQVWDIYGKLDAGYLEMLTHSEQPWQDARSGLQSSQSSDNEISTKAMKSFYSMKLEKVSKK
jgi:uncharacterized phage-associated protein